MGEEPGAFFPASETIILQITSEQTTRQRRIWIRGKRDESCADLSLSRAQDPDDERVRCGVSKKAIETATGHADVLALVHAKSVGVTRQNYATLQRLFNESSEGDFLRKEYDELSAKSGNDARTDAAKRVRRATPVSVSAKVP